MDSENRAKKWGNFLNNQARKMASITHFVSLSHLSRHCLGAGGENLLQFSNTLITLKTNIFWQFAERIFAEGLIEFEAGGSGYFYLLHHEVT